MVCATERDELVAKYKKMRSAVEAAMEQATQATMFHETWRPCAHDSDLLARMGTSFATHTFQITRWALRRELILTLMRLWDGNRNALSIKHIGDSLRKDDFFSVLAEERSPQDHSTNTYIVNMIRDSLEGQRQKVLPMIDKYARDGERFETFKLLRALRDKRLAHHEIKEPLTLIDPTDECVEEFYVDTLRIVSLLLHVVNGVAFDLNESASMFAHYAKFFWASVKGERTEGHPNYRQPMIDISTSEPQSH